MKRQTYDLFMAAIFFGIAAVLLLGLSCKHTSVKVPAKSVPTEKPDEDEPTCKLDLLDGLCIDTMIATGGST